MTSPVPAYLGHDRMCQHRSAKGNARCDCPLSRIRPGRPLAPEEAMATTSMWSIQGRPAHLFDPHGGDATSWCGVCGGTSGGPQHTPPRDVMTVTSPVGGSLTLPRCCDHPLPVVAEAETPTRAGLYCARCGNELLTLTW